MNVIIALHDDLKRYSSASIRLIANYLQLEAENTDDLRWLIAIHNSQQRGEMPLCQGPVIKSIVQNLTLKEALNYARVNRCSRKERDDWILPYAKATSMDFRAAIGKGDYDMAISLLKNENIDFFESYSLTLVANWILKNNSPVEAEKLLKIKAFNKLKYIDITDNPNFTDVSPLRHLTNLRDLDLRGTGVSDITPLRHLTKLTDLDLSKTPVQNIEALRDLPKLRGLDLDNTQVTSLEPLRGKEMETIDIRNTNIADLSPLLTMNLDKLIINNPDPELIQRLGLTRMWSSNTYIKM